MNATESRHVPRHIAIVMDGNGRWAQRRGLPRAAGHRAGVGTLRKIVEHCAWRRVAVLTVFAFSSENWRRPGEEVRFLLDLFLRALDEEIDELGANNVRFRLIGERSTFPPKLQRTIKAAEAQTADKDGLQLVVAANYGGRWDIAQAAREVARQVAVGSVAAEEVDEALLGENLSLGGLPDPDLFIRTGGEQRVSNYLLWQLAYTELYFSKLLWPEFSPDELDASIAWYAGRQRRFGKTAGQLSHARQG